MLFADIALLDENLEYKEHQWVGVEGNRISYVSDAAPDVASTGRFGEIYDGHNKLLMSAFFNAHAHAPMTLLRGYAEGLPLQEWLFGQIIPFEDKINGEDAYWATQLACAEMARFGIVSFSDMYYHTEHRLRAIEENGMKINVCDHLTALEDKPYREYEQYAFNKHLVERYHGAADGRVKVDFCIHAEYTTQPQVIAGLAELAGELDMRIHAHVSETRLEHEECKQRRGGLTPIQYFESLGVLEQPLTAAHCVWVEEEDIAIMAERGVCVSCNPAANMKLASGFAPIVQMLDAGVCVALGTDGVASNNNHDFMQDMYLMGLIYKGARLDPRAVGARDVLRAATRNGALSQGREECGRLRSGAAADLIVLDVGGPSWTPCFDWPANIVFAGHGSDVCLTMSDGRVVYRDGVWPTIDVKRAQAEVVTRAARIRGEL